MAWHSYSLKAVFRSISWTKVKPSSETLRGLEEPSRTLEAMVDAGHLGIKSGKGFYDYGGKPEEAILRTRDTRLLKMTRFMKQLDAQDG